MYEKKNERTEERNQFKKTSNQKQIQDPRMTRRGVEVRRGAEKRAEAELGPRVGVERAGDGRHDAAHVGLRALSIQLFGAFTAKR